MTMKGIAGEESRPIEGGGWGGIKSVFGRLEKTQALNTQCIIKTA